MISGNSATPNVDTPDDTIEGFPEFAFTIDTIKDPTIKARLRAIAKRIVASHSTSDKIIGFIAQGHADVTVRMPPGPERDQAEREISRDRADNAKELLLSLIEGEGGAPIMTGIKANTSSQAFGSNFNKFKPAISESQRRANRRVEIFLRISRQAPAPIDAGLKRITLWLNAFIPSDVKNGDGTAMSFKMDRGPHLGETAIPGPFNGKFPFFDDCYLTDQRSFDTFNKRASSRIHAEVEIDFTGSEPKLTTQPNGATVDTIRLRVSTGEVLNQKRGIARGGFSKLKGFVAGSKLVEVKFAVAGSNPIAKMPRSLFPPLPPSSLDPQTIGDPDIDLIGSFTVDAVGRQLKFRGLVDGFPSYEGYITVDGGLSKTIFQLAPQAGENPASGLPGLPNRVIEVDLDLK